MAGSSITRWLRAAGCTDSDMRLAIFTESYEPIVNGVSVSVRTLRDELTRRGHEVYVFAPGFKGHSDGRSDVFRLPSTHTPLMPDYPFPLPFAPGARSAFASLKLDLVHTQTPFLLGVMGAKWARRHGIPLVSTNHTLYTEYAHYVPVRPKAITRRFLVGLMKWYYTGCDAVVVPSTPVLERLRSYGIGTRIEVIKTGVVGAAAASPDQRAKAREEWGIPAGAPLLLYVGRVAREKNLTMLLEAFRRVLSNHPQARLLVVGGGPALAETRRGAESLGLGERVGFAGMRGRLEIDRLYAASDLFVFPSVTETQGVAICEALSAGLPVVAVEAGGIPENIRHGNDGFLSADNSDEFAAYIQRLIDDPRERALMGANARANSSAFSIERMVDDYERFYESVILSGGCVTTGALTG